MITDEMIQQMKDDNFNVVDAYIAGFEDCEQQNARIIQEHGQMKDMLKRSLDHNELWGPLSKEIKSLITKIETP